MVLLELFSFVLIVKEGRLMEIVQVVSFIFFILLSSIAVFIIWNLVRKKRNPKGTKEELEVSMGDLDTFPPLIAQFIDGKGASTRHITAGLIALVKKRVLKLSFDDQVNEYCFTDLQNNEVSLSKEESFLHEWFLYEIGNHGVFYASDLEHYTKEDEKREEFIQYLYEWEKVMTERLREIGYEVAFPVRKKQLLIIGSVMLLIGSSLLFFYPFVSLLYLVSAVVTSTSAFIFPNISDQGWSAFHRWTAYKDKITESPPVNFSESDKMTAGFIFALAFGIKDQFIEKFAIRDASQISLNQEHFPLYFAMAPGSAALSAESIKAVDEVEAVTEKVISPVGYFSDGDVVDGDST